MFFWEASCLSSDLEDLIRTVISNEMCNSLGTNRNFLPSLPMVKSGSHFSIGFWFGTNLVPASFSVVVLLSRLHTETSFLYNL